MSNIITINYTFYFKKYRNINCKPQLKLLYKSKSTDSVINKIIKIINESTQIKSTKEELKWSCSI